MQKESKQKTDKESSDPSGGMPSDQAERSSENKDVVSENLMVKEQKPTRPNIEEYDLSVDSPEAIVIYCNDPRFQSAFGQFIYEKLGLTSGQYIPVVMPGATASFSEPETFPKEFKVASDIVRLFLSKHDTIKLIVIINHEDCKKYEHMQERIGNSFLRVAKDMLNRQKIDLGKVAKTLYGLAGGKAKLRLFYAKFSNTAHTKAVFEEIAA